MNPNAAQQARAAISVKRFIFKLSFLGCGCKALPVYMCRGA
jgi:hypothetical protein